MLYNACVLAYVKIQRLEFESSHEYFTTKQFQFRYLFILALLHSYSWILLFQMGKLTTDRKKGCDFTVISELLKASNKIDAGMKTNEPQ